jgi:dUTP pyrophosphatase
MITMDEILRFSDGEIYKAIGWLEINDEILLKNDLIIDYQYEGVLWIDGLQRLVDLPQRIVGIDTERNLIEIEAGYKIPIPCIYASLCRGFKPVRYVGNQYLLPSHADEDSAGYDFHSLETVTIRPNEMHVFKTNIKAFMPNDEFLAIYPRSSIGIKKKLALANTVGIIDSSYYNNEDNEGNILIALYNYGSDVQTISYGERIAQGVFTEFKKSEAGYNTLKTKRTGGVGSSGK